LFDASVSVTVVIDSNAPSQQFTCGCRPPSTSHGDR
jgi:hypothetical protein